MNKDWTALALDSWALTLEASTVIGLRMAKLAKMDGDAVAEAQRMVTEKIEMTAQLQWKGMTGGLGTTHEAAARNAVSEIRTAVNENRRRLSRSRNG